MAPSTPSRRRAQHGSGLTRTILRDAAIALRLRQARPGPVIAKATAVTAAGGLAFALFVPAAPAEGDDTVALAAGEGVAAGTSGDYLAVPQRAEQRVSRAAQRAPVAVQAPALAAPAATPTFGELSFTAVEKPPPPPPPPPAPVAVAPQASSSAQRLGVQCSRSPATGQPVVVLQPHRRHSPPEAARLGGCAGLLVRPWPDPERDEGPALLCPSPA